jgi:glycosyltransferase involved in cell wall biosynthesis
MRIGINLLYLLPGIVGGTELYAVSLLSTLAANDPNNQYFVFINRESAGLDLPRASNFHTVACPINASNRLIRYLWEQTILPWQLLYFQIDLVHSLGYVGPVVVPCESVVTIPDMNSVALKSSLPKSKSLLLALFVRLAAKFSTHILTLSEFSKTEIIKYLAVDECKITVTHAAPRANMTEAVGWIELKAQYGIEKPYIVAFSSLTLHKNIPRLINAFGRICNVIPSTLVLLGHMPPNVDLTSQISEASLEQRVILTGFVPDNHVLPLLSNADMFIFPSWYEGFGLPILEAHQVGVAVASSNAGSLPEVAGAGAIFFDPFLVQEMAQAIVRCLTDSTLRMTLISRGYENLSRFSWDKTAKKTLAVYEAVYSAGRNQLDRIR